MRKEHQFLRKIRGCKTFFTNPYIVVFPELSEKTPSESQSTPPKFTAALRIHKIVRNKIDNKHRNNGDHLDRKSARNKVLSEKTRTTLSKAGKSKVTYKRTANIG